MTASRGRRCARSALMRPTTHRVKVEETSDIGSPREPTDENDLTVYRQVQKLRPPGLDFWTAGEAFTFGPGVLDFWIVTFP